MYTSLLYSTVPVLSNVLRDIHYFDFDVNPTQDHGTKHIDPGISDERLINSTKDWSLPDQLAYPFYLDIHAFTSITVIVEMK